MSVVGRGIKKLLVETVAYVFVDILFLESHTVLAILKNDLRLLKDKPLEIIPKYGRTEAKVGLRAANRIIFEIASHFK